MEEIISRKYRLLKPEWNERQRRLWAAGEALCLGHGGVSIVARATGLSRPTIISGMQELESNNRLSETAFVVLAADARRVTRRNRICCLRLMPSSNRPPKAIRCRRSGGRQKVPGD